MPSTTPRLLRSSVAAAVQDLEVLRQVESNVRERQTDVDLAWQWTQRLQTARKMAQLQNMVQGNCLAVEEMRAMQNHQREKEEALADKLVQELWSVSKVLGELQLVKESHEKLLVEHDQMVAKLMQAERDLEAPKAQPVAGADDSEKRSTPLNKSEEGLNYDADDAARQETITSTSPPLAEESSTRNPVVVLEEYTPSPQQLEELDNQILMHIFSFLDAYDILNTAQVNTSMYSRVDYLFGFGNNNIADDNSTIATNESIPPQTKQQQLPPPSADDSRKSSAQATQKHPEPSATQQTEIVASLATSTSVSPMASSKTVPTQTNISKKPNPSSSSQLATSSESLATATTTTTSESIDAAGPRKLLAAILQPLKPAGTASPSLPPPRVGRHRAPDSGTAPPMTADIANSVAAKLSDAEINAIILLTERLKQKEHVANQLVAEHEELTAKLEGMESVKQFLISRVKELEQTMTNIQEEDAKTAQQIGSDQEVIAFLDGRVQELELTTDHVAQEKMELVHELARVKEHAEKKSVVMGDMLQFERGRLAESERDWKAAKKLLIKEVKSCRAHIAALQAERDGFREQNERLRQAVLSSNSSSIGVAANINMNPRTGSTRSWTQT